MGTEFNVTKEELVGLADKVVVITGIASPFHIISSLFSLDSYHTRYI